MRRYGLRIRATKQWKAILLPSPGQAGYLIKLEAPVQIEGLELRAPTGGDCARIETMILLVAFARIHANRIRPAGTNTIGRCGYDVGIQVRNADFEIKDNAIRDFRRTGIAVRRTGNGDIPRVIIDNELRFEHATETSTHRLHGSGISITFGRGVVSRNAISGLRSAGAGGRNGTPLLETGLAVFDAVASVSGNAVRHVGSGIRAVDSQVEVAANRVRDSRADGIHVAGGASCCGALVGGNRVLDSGANGIEVADAQGNVRGNMALRSGGTDCVDRTVSGTWIGNIGETSDPPGLCTPPAP